MSPSSPGNGRRRAVSMMDVARAAGVSQKTVSRVVNDEPHVKDELKARVEKAIAELGFRPNQAARSLVTQRTMRIGVVSMGSSYHGPAALLGGIQSAAQAADYFPVVVRVHEPSTSAMQAAIDELVAQGAEGIVLSESIDIGHPELELPSGIPVVTLDARAEARESELVVGADEISGARLATEHLLALGHQQVRHIGGAPTWSATQRRVAGWRQALSDAGIVAPEVRYGDWSPTSGYRIMQQLLAEGDVTAVFAANDHMAIGAMRAIQDAGLSVPEHISLVGFDDLPESEFLPIALSTVRQDFEEVARVAVYRLIKAIEGTPPAQQHRLIPVQLLRRESTAKALRV